MLSCGTKKVNGYLEKILNTRFALFNWQIVLFQEREFVPISPLKYNFPFHYMEKAASAKPKRIFPFQNGPLAIFEDVFNDRGHFNSKFIPEHFIYGLLAHDRFIADLMIHSVIGIQRRNRLSISVVKCVHPPAYHFFWS